jgi:citrate lyase subunit beta / citryl-CoA lyase
MDRGIIKPVRTALFVAGSNEDELTKCPDYGADLVVIDIEEPRTPYPEHERERTRKLVGEFLSSAPTGPGRPLYFVRVQAIDSGRTWIDLRAVVQPALQGIVQPKIQGPVDVAQMDALLTAIELDTGRPPGDLMIYPIFETANSLRLAYEIAMASPRIKYMGGAVSRFGDIHQAIGFRWTPEGRESLFLRSKLLIDARAAGVRYPISGMWGGGLNDIDGLRRWATELRDLGYYGMMIGADEHVALVNEIFSPTSAEIAYWKELDALAREAEAKGTGPILHGDPSQGEAHVVHIAHIGSARLNLEWARGLGLA